MPMKCKKIDNMWRLSENTNHMLAFVVCYLKKSQKNAALPQRQDGHEKELIFRLVLE